MPGTDKRLLARTPGIPETTANQTCSVTGNSRFGSEIDSVNLIPQWLTTALGSGGTNRG